MGRVKKRKGAGALFGIPVGTYDLWKPTLFVSPLTFNDLMRDCELIKRYPKDPLWAWTYEFIYDPRLTVGTMSGMLKEAYSDRIVNFLPKEIAMPRKSEKTATPVDTRLGGPDGYGTSAAQSDLDFYKSRCAELERDKALLAAKIEALNSALAIVTKNATRSSEY